MEGAAARRIERRGELALELDLGAPLFGIGDRRRREQRPRIGVQRPPENLLDRRDLHRPAEIHHHHVVGDEAHDREIVADEDVGEAELLLQVGEQVQDLRLDRDVERRDRLVEHDDFRLQHQRAGDGDALPLAAGEHVRIAPVMLRPEADARTACRAPWRAARGRIEVCVDDQRLLQDRADLLARIERAVGVLEDDLHGAAQRLQRARGRRRRRRRRR